MEEEDYPGDDDAPKALALDNAVSAAQMPEVKAVRDALHLMGERLASLHDAWLQYGEALNALRRRYPSDEMFGRMVTELRLDQIVWANPNGSVCDNMTHTVSRHARVAAMWAAEHPDELARTQAEYPERVVTDAGGFRGLHAKWKGGTTPTKKPSTSGRKGSFGEDATEDDVLDYIEERFGGDEAIEACKSFIERRSAKETEKSAVKAVRATMQELIEAGAATVDDAVDFIAEHFGFSAALEACRRFVEDNPYPSDEELPE